MVLWYLQSGNIHIIGNGFRIYQINYNEHNFRYTIIVYNNFRTLTKQLLRHKM